MFLQRIFSLWAAISVRHSRRVLIATALVALAATPFAIHALRHIDVNLFNQASAQLKRFQLMREITENFGGETLVAVATIPDQHSEQDVRELKSFALLLTAELEKAGTSDEDLAGLFPSLRAEIDRLAASTKTPPPQPAATDDSDSASEPAAPAAPKHPAWLRNVECRVGQSMRNFVKTLGRRRPYVLIEPADVESMRKLFEPAALATRMDQIAADIPDLPPNSLEKKKLYEDPLGVANLAESALRERLQRLAPPWALASDGFFLSPDGTTLLVLGRAVLPSSRLDFNRALMAAAQRAENRAVLAFRATNPQLSIALKGTSYGALAAGESPGRLQVGFTGMAAIFVENERTLNWDMAVNTVTSLLGILLLFLILYRSVMLTWHVIWTTLLIIWLTIAYAGIARGGMSLLGSAFTAVPVGIATDYAILIYNAFQDHRRSGLGPEEAMRRTLVQAAPAILTGALITAVAFFGVGFTHLTGLSEFGILGGVSTIIGAAVMLFVLPSSIAPSWRSRTSAALGPQSRPGPALGLPALGRLLETKSFRNAALVLSVLMLLSCVLVIRFGPDPGPETVAGVRFDPELGNLRSLTNRAIPLRELVTHRFHVGLADINTIVEAPTESAALDAQEKLEARARPFIARGELKRERSALDFLPSERKQRENMAALKQFDIDAAIRDFQSAAEKRFGVKGAAYFKPFLRQLRDFKMVLADPQPLTLTEASDGPLGNMLAPYATIGAPGEAARAVRLRSSWLPKDSNQPSTWYAGLATALESNDAQSGSTTRLTAAKMVGFELKDTTLRDCGWITLIVTTCVVVFLAAALRAVVPCLLALLPLVYANLTMLAGVPISQWLGWEYTLNFINLLMFPLLLSSSVDYGVYMVVAFDEHTPRVSALMAQTGRAVLYCMATTLIGFGSFITSSYTGLLSMGVASLWGYAGATFGSLFALPAILACFPRKNPSADKI